MTYQKKQEVSASVERYLRDNRLYADVQPYWDDLPVIEVEIHWGDWKHDHLRAKWLLKEIGIDFINTVVTEENGSDCYSAVHRFYVSEDAMKGVAA